MTALNQANRKSNRLRLVFHGSLGRESRLCRKRVRSVCKNEEGAEILEFAIVFSMLMTLMLGVVVFARAYNVYQTIARAAREGAREAVLPSAVSAGNNYSNYWTTGAPPACGSTSASTASAPNTNIFKDYIQPALLAANLNPNAVQNYTECATYLNPSDAYQQCGLMVSFHYPYPLSIPFLGASLGTVDLKTQVQMRLENPTIGGGCS